MKNNRFWAALIAGIMAGVLLLSLLLGLFASTAHAASSSEIKDQISDLEGEQNDMQQKLDELEGQKKENLTQIQDISEQKSIIEQQVGLLYEQVKNINEQIAAYSLLIADKQEELDEAEAYLAELNEKNKERIRAMEEDGSISYWAVLFQANSFSDFLDRLNMIQEISASDKRRLDEMSQAAKEVAEAKQTLQEEKAQLEESREALAVKQEELDIKAEEAQSLLTQLIAKGEEYDELLDQQEQELSKLEQEIAKKEEEYDDAVYKEWLATSVPPTPKPPVNNYGGGTGGASVTPPSGLTWVVPCDYSKVSSPFGWRIHPVYGDWRFHAGVDLNAGHTPIYATRAGVVVTSQYSSSAGYYVVIDHGDGFKSTYMHMCKFPDVKVGDIVAAGQVIGCVGTTGTSTGLHLHFGISYNGESVNPMDYIG